MKSKKQKKEKTIKLTKKELEYIIEKSKLLGALELAGDLVGALNSESSKKSKKRK